MNSKKAVVCAGAEEERREDASVSVIPTLTSSTMSSRLGVVAPKLCVQGSGECAAVNTLSPMCNNNPVPRSFSDINCQHSRAGSDVSSETSRASAGASLEKFFNQMGMEREVLDPMVQLQQQHHTTPGKEGVFESISSLDSHDARSICSAFSRSEKEVSDSEWCERNQQQASAVERNARIIKWLCNVKKAKTTTPNAPSNTSS